MLFSILVDLPRSFFRSVLYQFVCFIRAVVQSVKLRGRVKFNGLPIIRGKIEWGRNVVVNSSFSSNLYGLFQRSIIYAYDGAEIVIGDNCGLSGVTLNSRKRIEIGRGTLIGGNAKIIDHDFHPVNFRFRNPDIVEKIGVCPVEIGEKCFIGGGYGSERCKVGSVLRCRF